MSADTGLTVVIVGAGLAGVRAAEGVRQAGFSGRLILVGEEGHPPYDRPPLSKMVLTNPGEEQKIGLLRPQDLEGLNVELRLGQRVVSLDRSNHTIALADGGRIVYDRLVIATGSTVKTLPDLPPQRPRVHYLRGLDDALALRQALATADRVAIVGAGVIGLEVASAAVELGRSVTIVEAGDRVMARAASPVVARFIADRHRNAGVDLRFATTVNAVADQAHGLSLTLSDGTTLGCSLVVVGVGVTPNDGLARESGLEVDPGGIIVDGHGVTSDPAILAAGEVAVHFNELHGRHDRQETWAHASAHGEHVGRSIMAPNALYSELSSYWSDQFDFTLNVFGVPIGETDVVRGDPQTGKFLVFHLIAGKVAGVSGVNAGRDLRGARRLVGSDRPFDAAVLANPATNLNALV